MSAKGLWEIAFEKQVAAAAAHIFRARVGSLHSCGALLTQFSTAMLPSTQALKAEANGADYVGAGAVYHTDTKESSAIGLDALAEICRVRGVPVGYSLGCDECLPGACNHPRMWFHRLLCGEVHRNK